MNSYGYVVNKLGFNQIATTTVGPILIYCLDLTLNPKMGMSVLGLLLNRR